MNYSLLFVCLLVSNALGVPSSPARKFSDLEKGNSLDCVSCGGALVACVYACTTVVPCLACAAGISSTCYNCADYLCSASKINDMDARLTCWLGMPSYACDLNCKCRYKKSGGSCSNNTCYCY